MSETGVKRGPSKCNYLSYYALWDKKHSEQSKLSEYSFSVILKQQNV